MKKLFLASIMALSATLAFAEDWATTINDAPDGAKYLINGKSVKKAVAQELDMATVESVTISNDSVMIYTKVHQLSEGEKQEAHYPGGKEALDAFFAENLVYPEADKPNKINGYVVVKFMISSEGKIVSPEVVRSLSPTIDAEALRLVNIMPDWVPGYVSGQAVTSIYQLPILFKCPRPEKPAKK